MPKRNYTTWTWSFFTYLVIKTKNRKKQPLSLKEHLNIECDTAAAKLNAKLTNQEIPMQHPQIPQGSPHLVINGEIITCQFQQRLQNAATVPNYHKYLQDKYKWSTDILTRIDWPVFTIAINWFKVSEQQTLQKFIHRWLPLQMWPQVQSLSTNKLCPSCRRQPKDK